MKKDKAPRAHAEDFLKQMQEENGAQKGSEVLESQIERLKNTINEVNKVCDNSSSQ